MKEHYVLQGRLAIPVDFPQWATWYEANRTTKCQVAQTTMGDTCVSTSFTGLDYSRGVGPVLVFETRVFGGPLDGQAERCTTWFQAEMQHAKIVRDLARHEPDIQHPVTLPSNQ